VGQPWIMVNHALIRDSAFFVVFSWTFITPVPCVTATVGGVRTIRVGGIMNSLDMSTNVWLLLVLTVMKLPGMRTFGFCSMLTATWHHHCMLMKRFLDMMKYGTVYVHGDGSTGHGVSDSCLCLMLCA